MGSRVRAYSVKMRSFLDYLLSHPLELLTAIGEFVVAYVIYLEVERARLDRFYDAAYKKELREGRRDIYEAFCSLPEPSTEAFRLRLKGDPKLRKTCEEQMNFLQMVGGELPVYPPFRGRMLNWFPHAIVFLWVILEGHIRYRRRVTGYSLWQNNFERYAKTAARYILRKIDAPEIVLLDPNEEQGRNYSITRADLKHLSRGKPL
jgi:hypothetical protein